jgi:hypothetical protein
MRARLMSLVGRDFQARLPALPAPSVVEGSQPKGYLSQPQAPKCPIETRHGNRVPPSLERAMEIASHLAWNAPWKSRPT